MAAIIPISELSTYRPKWTIRARVTAKAPLRTFSKNGNAGKVFHVDLLDAEGGEIRANIFGTAVDTYFDKLQPGKCYTFSGGSVRIANRQFNTCNHRYEIVFDKGAVVEDAEDDAQIKVVQLKVTDLRFLRTKVVPCTVDLCGVLVGFRPTLSFTSKDGKELTKREVTLADDTGNSIAVTLWGDRAKQEDKVFSNSPLVAFKGVNVKEWGTGRNGSLLEGGAMLLEPALQEADRVRQWWSQGGSTQALASLSQEGGGGGGSSRAATGKAVSISEMRKAAERVTSEQPEVFSVVCRLALVQMKKQGETVPLVFMSCQEPKETNGWPCNRRLDEQGFCAACNRAGKAAPRFNVRCRFSDFEDSAWLTTFHEGAVRVLGMEGQQARDLEKAEGREALESAIRNQYFTQPLQVTARAKLDNYNGEPRVNIICAEARPVNLGEHGRVLLQEIQEMLAAGATRAGGA